MQLVQLKRDDYVLARCHHVFRSRWSSCLDLFCRETPQRSYCARAAELMNVSVLIASWPPHREET